MTRLWRALEDSPTLREVIVGWRRQLGTEFDVLRHFFIATSSLPSSCYLSSRDRWRWLVIDDGHRIFARDPKTFEDRCVQRSDVLLHRVDMRAIARQICEAMQGTDRFETLGGTQHLTRVGNLPASLNSLPMYFCTQRYESDVVRSVHLASSHAEQEFVLLTPTNRPMSPEAARWLGRAGGVSIAADELVKVEDGRFLRREDAVTKIQRLLGMEVSESPAYQFQLCGEKHRLASFAGNTFVLNETPGTFYLAIVLASPRQLHSATRLESMRSGIHEVAKSGAVGTQIDEQAKRDYGQRLRDVMTEIEEIQSSAGEIRLAELHAEREMLVQTLKSATGLAGELRERVDADRSRQSVCAAIRRAFKSIRANNAELAEYLETTVNLGFDVQYLPPTDLDWRL
ncbi:hypothetical protein FYK55_18195 [Roseiconus nitratireducens]|uniref:Uncharacterized protein n=1 Tax=Roseiconus nitratireducens TaxID=2605748 RepID=A0A5M6D6N5_9BACT|nr:hypothetical protein [Roseiconus nitratireducens]KAA5541489.1 hypothetical protein FYK55_18195 [Roseiconus nitratireducens]